MLKLKFNNEPYWIDLGCGVQVKVKPCTYKVFSEAKAYMRHKLNELLKNCHANQNVGTNEEDIEKLDDPIKREAVSEKYLVIGLGIYGIIEWKGLLDADKDELAPLNEHTIEELFSNFWSITESFLNQYSGVRELMEAEKNVSTPEPNGTLVTGEAIVKDVEHSKSTVQSENVSTSKRP